MYFVTIIRIQKKAPVVVIFELFASLGKDYPGQNHHQQKLRQKKIEQDKG